MVRMTRAAAQERNRARILAAARAEFTERGYRETKIDGIAERAELTRGAVYSNFPGKRALYFAVLAEEAEREPAPPHPAPDATVRQALGALARGWVAGLPLATDPGLPPAADLLAEVAADDLVRHPYAQLKRLDAIVLGAALERLAAATGPGPGRRMVRLAELALTMLHGAAQLAVAAPGFGEPFHVVLACERLAGLDLDDRWTPPAVATPARPADKAWTPPPAGDALRGEDFDAAGDAIVAVLGLHRICAVEEALRGGGPVTAALVTGHPGELLPLARLSLAQLRGHLRRAVPPGHWPRLRVVLDDSGAFAAAAGVAAVSDATETAVVVRDGRIVARADGWGACHAATLA